MDSPLTSNPAASTPSRFEYVGQTSDGMRMDGSIEAVGLDSAMARLIAIGVHVHEIHPRASSRPDEAGREVHETKSQRPLTPADFAMFNEQLAQLAASGLPLEHGLRLIAEDMRRGRLATAIQEVADELSRGVPLGEAFDRHRGRFPSLYGRMIEAGVRSGNLGGVLLGVGHHQELVQRLRGAFWRTLAYPIMVFAALGVVLVFLGIFVLPRFEEIFNDFRLELPFPTRVVLGLRSAAPYIGIAILAVVIGIPALWAFLKASGRDRAAVDRLIVPLPIIGRIFQLSMIARWCDALRIAVSAGLDLPAAIDLASDAVGSPKLREDGVEMKKSVESGAALQAARRGIIPATIPAAIEMSSGQNTLAATLESLSQTYRRQAEMRVAAVPVLLTPVAVILMGIIIGFVILALFMPLISLIQGVSSSN